MRYPVFLVAINLLLVDQILSRPVRETITLSRDYEKVKGRAVSSASLASTQASITKSSISSNVRSASKTLSSTSKTSPTKPATSSFKSTVLSKTVSPPATQHVSSMASSISAKASSKSSAAASSSTGCVSASGDAPYSLSCSALASVITFPNGFQNKAGGIVFLVHGTGSTGSETWSTGPYNTILPNKGIGYDIAWFTSPTRSLGDAQVNAEYIAYNIKALAQKSRTGKVFIIGHSQGNINIQWALEFWPSMRQYVSGFASLAGDFHGTAEGPLLCTGQDLLQGGCEPSVLQQSVGSHYLAAQNAQGGAALVTTTSLYTLEDDIIQPEVINPTSDIPGATVISVQQACPTYITDHFGMTVAAPAFYLAYDALTHGGQASLTRFTSSQCTFLGDATIPNPFVEVPGLFDKQL
ncbi:uncharacterized protein IL334_002239 [Kwoniella shivajii]|uniref:Lipase n=1 Tax=Kwoniella shivajii TaxID=564305 RepID=A0ABZ1CUG5_9TREE|nr:hypothetical protein IL334_002239 [Kwoniella shivajii]